jgi:hypothetical protein
MIIVISLFVKLNKIIIEIIMNLCIIRLMKLMQTLSLVVALMQTVSQNAKVIMET